MDNPFLILGLSMSKKRKSLSKKIRFEVFKRDGFTCAYCGKTPPEVILEIDHIDPISKGGKDNINNLITACFDCNRGKGDIKLNLISPGMIENFEILKLKEEQLKEYKKLTAEIKRRINKDIKKIENIFIKHFPQYGFSDSFRVSIKIFLKSFTVDQLCDNMQISCSKFYNEENCDILLRYFCGICWNQIREKKNG
jgi:hypothetical protein